MHGTRQFLKAYGPRFFFEKYKIVFKYSRGVCVNQIYGLCRYWFGQLARNTCNWMDGWTAPYGDGCPLGCDEDTCAQG